MPRAALLIGIHSGAPLHGTAHDALMAAPGIGWYLRRMGVLPAAPDSITGALAAGRDVARWPGGEVDSLRPWVRRDEAELAGRTGFVRLAIKTGRADRADRHRRPAGRDACDRLRPPPGQGVREALEAGYLAALPESPSPPRSASSAA